MSTELRAQICAIPMWPKGMNFSKAWNEGRGVMTPEERALFPLYDRNNKLRESTKFGSGAWGRVNPKNLFSTIVVALNAADSRVGRTLHWDENRYLTTSKQLISLSDSFRTAVRVMRQVPGSALTLSLPHKSTY